MCVFEYRLPRVLPNQTSYPQEDRTPVADNWPSFKTSHKSELVPIPCHKNRQHFQILSQPLDQLVIKCEDNETVVEKLIAEDSHRESSESTKRQSMDERVVRKRRQLKRKSSHKRVIRKPVVEDIKPKHNKTSFKTNTKTNAKQMNDKNEDMSEESDESYGEELGEESDDSYVETKTKKAIKRQKPTKSGSKSRSSQLIPDFNERQKIGSKDCLRSHMQSHNTNRKFVCDFIGCEKTFTSTTGLCYHRRRHRSEPTFKCSTHGCDEMFFTLSQCHKHEVSVHSRAPKSKRIRRCDWPGCEWTGANSLKHKLRHTGEKRFPCLWPECGKRFGRIDYFKRHMNIHNNVKPYACHWPGYKQHFQTLSQPLDQLVNKCEDNETIAEKLIAEDSHRESSESTKRQSIDERVVRKRRQLKRKSSHKRVIRKLVVEDIKPKHNKTSVKTNTKTNAKQMNDKNEDMSEESDESYVEKLGEESDDSYVETKTKNAMKRQKPTKSGSKSCVSLLIPDLKERQKMFDLTTNSYKCRETDCQKTFETDESFRKHLYRHQTNRVFKCEYNGCDKQYRNRGSLKNHEMSAHSSDKPFKCDYNGCRYRFDSEDNLRNHRQRHNTNTITSFVCDFIGCEKTFTTRSALREHRRRHQSGPTYKCSTDGCVELFFTRSQLMKHQVSVHNRKPYVYSCDWPGCEWTGANGLKHKLQHTGEKRFPCLWPECGKRHMCVIGPDVHTVTPICLIFTHISNDFIPNKQLSQINKPLDQYFTAAIPLAIGFKPNVGLIAGH
ncbi:unnamed protein product [Medioppia subpectinata]|uniref:C2H2-type domain-containing protein n=1 Tax=Medioppia subpectinata TaxID=1979941 RepID=A0A7R9KRK6_9ACAR|nr:unnamed protein product [Medioppia subpectinata]CAG2108516.1 unnamed protein product [Medioppia subpectinata]